MVSAAAEIGTATAQIDANKAMDFMAIAPLKWGRSRDEHSRAEATTYACPRGCEGPEIANSATDQKNLQDFDRGVAVAG